MRSYIYIPPSVSTAKKHLRSTLSRSLRRLPRRDFLKAYCSFCYLYPGFHPDDIEDWDGPKRAVQVAREAWRRADAGLLTNLELYPYPATKAAIRHARSQAHSE